MDLENAPERLRKIAKQRTWHQEDVEFLRELADELDDREEVYVSSVGGVRLLGRFKK